MLNLEKILTLLALLICFAVSHSPAFARKLTACESLNELKKSSFDQTFVRKMVCIMKYDGKFNTSQITGLSPSYSYGVFLIKSDKWCNTRRPGGFCNKKCSDFLDDNIQDDITCAKTIFDKAGLQYWPSYKKKCEKSDLPELSSCKNADDNDDNSNDNSNSDNSESDSSSDSSSDSDEQLEKEVNEESKEIAEELTGLKKGVGALNFEKLMMNLIRAKIPNLEQNVQKQARPIEMTVL